MPRYFLMIAAIAGFIAVAMGAFGAHGLKHMLTAERLAVYHTAVDYQFWHALGLALIALLAMKSDLAASKLLVWAGWSMILGLVLFSGSLYVLCLTGITWLGMITPIGGTAFLVAWLLLAIYACKFSGS